MIQTSRQVRHFLFSRAWLKETCNEYSRFSFWVVNDGVKAMLRISGWLSLPLNVSMIINATGKWICSLLVFWALGVIVVQSRGEEGWDSAGISVRTFRCSELFGIVTDMVMKHDADIQCLWDDRVYGSGQQTIWRPWHQKLYNLWELSVPSSCVRGNTILHEMLALAWIGFTFSVKRGG